MRVPATDIEFNTGGLFYGWSEADVASVDKDATEASLIKILSDIAPGANIVILWVDGNDRLFGSWDSPTEKDDVRREISEYPWYDAQRWAVFK
jgi:hypothetical protein